MDNQQETKDDFLRQWYFGVFDGDGSFSLIHQTNQHSLVPCIGFSNSNLKLIDAVRLFYRRLHLPYYIRTISSDNKNHTIRYEVQIRGIKRAKRYFDALSVYEGIKYKEFDVLNQFVNYRLMQSMFTPTGNYEMELYTKLKQFHNTHVHIGDIIFQSLTEKAKAWLGGIIDAEGSITLNNRYYDNGSCYVPSVTITNTSGDIIFNVMQILELANIHYYSFKNTDRSSKRRECWRIRLAHNNSCSKFCELFGDYVLGKHDNIIVMNDFLNADKATTLEKREYKKYLYREMYALNHHGLSRDYTSNLIST